MSEVLRFHGNRYFGVAVYRALPGEQITLNFGIISPRNLFILVARAAEVDDAETS